MVSDESLLADKERERERDRERGVEVREDMLGAEMDGSSRRIIGRGCPSEGPGVGRSCTGRPVLVVMKQKKLRLHTGWCICLSLPLINNNKSEEKGLRKKHMSFSYHPTANKRTLDFVIAWLAAYHSMNCS